MWRIPYNNGVITSLDANSIVTVVEVPSLIIGQSLCNCPWDGIFMWLTLFLVVIYNEWNWRNNRKSRMKMPWIICSHHARRWSNSAHWKLNKSFPISNSISPKSVSFWKSCKTSLFMCCIPVLAIQSIKSSETILGSLQQISIKKREKTWAVSWSSFAMASSDSRLERIFWTQAIEGQLQDPADKPVWTILPGSASFKEWVS